MPSFTASMGTHDFANPFNTEGSYCENYRVQEVSTIFRDLACIILIYATDVFFWSSID
jgi:hypothetical protein